MQKILQITLALGLVFGLSGCDFLGFLGSTLEEQDLGVNFDPESGEVSFNLKGEEEKTTEPVAEISTNSDLPQGWDGAVVIYPASEVVDTLTTISRGITTATLVLSTGDSLSTVRDFYRGVLVAGGYTLLESADTEVKATKETKALTITLSLKGNKTQAKIMLSY